MVKVVDFSALDHSTISSCGCKAVSDNVNKPSSACGCVVFFCSRGTSVFVPLTDPFVSIPVKQLGGRKTEQNQHLKKGLSEVDTAHLSTYCTKCEELL